MLHSEASFGRSYNKLKIGWIKLVLFMGLHCFHSLLCPSHQTGFISFSLSFWKILWTKLTYSLLDKLIGCNKSLCVTSTKAWYKYLWIVTFTETVQWIWFEYLQNETSNPTIGPHLKERMARKPQTTHMGPPKPLKSFYESWEGELRLKIMEMRGQPGFWIDLKFTGLYPLIQRDEKSKVSLSFP